MCVTVRAQCLFLWSTGCFHQWILYNAQSYKNHSDRISEYALWLMYMSLLKLSLFLSTFFPLRICFIVMIFPHLCLLEMQYQPLKRQARRTIIKLVVCSDPNSMCLILREPSSSSYFSFLLTPLHRIQFQTSAHYPHQCLMIHFAYISSVLISRDYRFH